MSPESIIAVSSIVIALAALGATIWQGLLTRRHNRLSVTPRLRVDCDHPDDGEVVVTLMNTGLGPAVILGYEVKAESAGRELPRVGRLGEAVRALGVAERFYAYTPSPGDVFAAGETRTLLSFKPAKDTHEERERVVGALSSVTLHLDYESMYGDRQSLVVTAVGLRPGERPGC